jgi:hypothetical protein
MSIVNRRSGGNLMRLCRCAEVETMREADDLDTRLAAQAELDRRDSVSEPTDEPTWCEINDVW